MTKEAIYRIPVKPHGPKARTKGCVAYLQRQISDHGHEIVADPDAMMIHVMARTHAEAAKLLQSQYLPGDSRPIKGRNMVRYFRSPFANYTAE